MRAPPFLTDARRAPSLFCSRAHHHTRPLALACAQAVHLLKPGGYIAVSDFTVTPQHNSFTRFLWPFILGQDGVRPSTKHIPYLNARFTEVHLTVDRGGFPYVREIALLVGALLGALVACSAVGAQLRDALGAPPAVPVWAALLLAARLAATVALLSASLGAFSLCPTKSTTLRVVKFATCVAIAALAWRLPFAPQLDAVSAGLEGAWAAAERALPQQQQQQLGEWRTAAREVPLWALGALGGGIVGLVVNSKLLKAPYYVRFAFSGGEAGEAQRPPSPRSPHPAPPPPLRRLVFSHPRNAPTNPSAVLRGQEGVGPRWPLRGFRKKKGGGGGRRNFLSTVAVYRQAPCAPEL